MVPYLKGAGCIPMLDIYRVGGGTNWECSSSLVIPVFPSRSPSNPVFSIRTSVTPTCGDFFSEFLYYSPIPFIGYVSFTALMVIYFYVHALSALLVSKHFKGRNYVLFAQHLLLRKINVLTITGRHKKGKRTLAFCIGVLRGEVDYDWQHRLELWSSCPQGNVLVG